MNRLVLLLCFTFAFCKSADPDYYWRVFSLDGEIPQDVVPGPEVCGRKSYFTTAPVAGEGRLYGRYLENSADVKVCSHLESDLGTADPKHSISNNIYILSSPNPEKFQWVETTSDTIHQIQDYMVPSGYDGVQHYIGMTGNLTGKVADYGRKGFLLYYFTENERQVSLAGDFSVLVYKQ